VSLRFKSLGSGSAGNGTLIQSQKAGRVFHLMVDCGFSQSHLRQRLALAGIAAHDLSGIFITHEHGDHVGCAVGFALKESIPLWMSEGTYRAIGSPALGALLHIARDGETIELGDLQLRPFTVPHDAREPLQLRCGDGDRELGVLTDLGHTTTHVEQALRECNALLLECNHDADLLAASRYPPMLKRRISGRLGHLENALAGAFARKIHHPRLHTVVAAHLSERNNQPELAAQCLAEALGSKPQDIVVASAAHGTPWLTV
jgi:phosphoribosyl 1,2-cyclic phosphodiesterase